MFESINLNQQSDVVNLNPASVCSRVTIIILCSIGGLIAFFSSFSSIFLLANYVPYEIGDDKIALHIINTFLNFYLITLCIIGCIINCASLAPTNSKWYVSKFLIVSVVNINILFIFSMSIDIPYSLGHSKISLEEEMNKHLNLSSLSEVDESRRTLDHIQQYFDCCGTNGASDYIKNNISVPLSCGESRRGCIDQLIMYELATRSLTTMELFIWFAILVISLFSYKNIINPDLKSIARAKEAVSLQQEREVMISGSLSGSQKSIQQTIDNQENISKALPLQQRQQHQQIGVGTQLTPEVLDLTTNTKIIQHGQQSVEEASIASELVEKKQKNGELQSVKEQTTTIAATTKSDN